MPTLIKNKFDNIEFWLIGEIDKDNPAMVKEEDLIRWVRNKTIIYHGFKENVKKFLNAISTLLIPHGEFIFV